MVVVNVYIIAFTANCSLEEEDSGLEVLPPAS